MTLNSSLTLTVPHCPKIDIWAHKSAIHNDKVCKSVPVVAIFPWLQNCVNKV